MGEAKRKKQQREQSARPRADGFRAIGIAVIDRLMTEALGAAPYIVPHR